VAPADWTRRLAGAADEMISLSTPTAFSAIGRHYLDFGQTTDEEVIACLDRSPPTADGRIG
jgi:putative phosphoribosyl transferase